MRNILIIFLLFFILPASYAQDSRVTTGVVSYANGGYEKALENFNIALENPSKLKAKNVPKAYYYRAKTNYIIFQKAIQEKDPNLVKGNILIEISEDLKLAEKNDDGKWIKKIELEYQNLKPVLLQYAMMLMEANELESAEKHLLALNDIEENYIVYDYLGQIKNTRMYHQTALKDWNKSIDLFQSNKPETPDMFVAYIFYRKAMVHYYYSGEYSEIDGMYIPTERDIDLAFASIAEGKKMLDKEYQRLIDETSTDKNKESTKNQYQTIERDLTAIELDLYLKTPARLEKAIVEFEKASKEQPDNYIIHVSYANLLEKKDKDLAIKMYKKSIAIDPNKITANFNLGAIYTNMAAEYAKQANEAEDYDVADKLNEKSIEYLILAKPFFEKCLEIDSKNMEVIRALKQTSIQLNLVDDYKKYQEMEKGLK